MVAEALQLGAPAGLAMPDTPVAGLSARDRHRRWARLVLVRRLAVAFGYRAEGAQAQVIDR